MYRARMTLAYDGSFFNGFQIQKDEHKGCMSVAGLLTKALHTLNIDTKVIGSGRTDTGVHALAQVIHCDVKPFWKEPELLKHHLNHLLQPHLHLKKIEYVDEGFHARFSAKKRLYRYVMYDGVYQPFFSNYALHVKPLDVKFLNECARHFIGTHHFGFFKKTKGAETKEERTIYKAGAYRHKGFIVLFFQGDAFLRSQIRMMTSMLLKVCDGKLTYEQLIAQRDKTKRSSTTVAPACGLYLSRIFY